MSSSSITESSSSFTLLTTTKKVSFDYTPNWGRGTPKSYIDNVKFSAVLTDKDYKYRIIIGKWDSGEDLGVRSANKVQDDGSQFVNFLEWHKGRGIADQNTISVYVVDPDNGNQVLVAQWN